MYESYTHQALPPKKYRELVGTAICVFSSNNAFVIENILRNADPSTPSWHSLIDETSGKLLPAIKATITKASDTKIAQQFEMIISKRNRIIHSYQVMDSSGEEILATKDSKHLQYAITEQYLLDFIQDNDKLSSMLHDLRGF